MKHPKILVLAGVIGAATVVTFALYGAGGSGHKTFPSAGIDLIEHDLTVGLFAPGPGSGGRLVETLEFDGRMLIERGDPFVNPEGLRQIDFQVLSWEAVAWSDALQTLVVYSTREGVDQQPSSIVAQQPEADFPATFIFKVFFDATAFGTVFFKDHHGMPVGHDFFEVPPTGHRRRSPTITTFETEIIEIDHPELGRISFRPIDCKDREGKTLVTFTPDQKKDLNLFSG